jgi:hypothetical protein
MANESNSDDDEARDINKKQDRVECGVRNSQQLNVVLVNCDRREEDAGRVIGWL